MFALGATYVCALAYFMTQVFYTIYTMFKLCFSRDYSLRMSPTFRSMKCLQHRITQVSESYAFEIVMIVTSLPAFMAVFFAHFIVESPRFLGVSKSLVETEQALIDYG